MAIENVILHLYLLCYVTGDWFIKKKKTAYNI